MRYLIRDVHEAFLLLKEGRDEEGTWVQLLRYRLCALMVAGGGGNSWYELFVLRVGGLSHA